MFKSSEIYCKRGYFRWGKFCENVRHYTWVLISRYQCTFHSSVYRGCYSPVGVMFATSTQSRKTRKLKSLRSRDGAFKVGVASQAEDADFSQAPGITSGFQGI